MGSVLDGPLTSRKLIMHVSFYAYTDQGPKLVGNYDWPEDFPLPNIGEETTYGMKPFLINRKVVDLLFNAIRLYTITSATEYE
jgi:hypothetical protein